MNTMLTIYEKAKENRITLTEMRKEGTEEVSINIAIQALEVAERLALELMTERDKARQAYDLLDGLPERLRNAAREVMYL